MPITTTAGLSTLLNLWWEALQGWASDGRLLAAAMDALQLGATPQALVELNGRLAAGDPSALPAVEPLEAGAMGGALGAYASGTGTIYLNASWLETADQRAALAVLTEELGHHLDAVLNAADTPGDEGAVFAELLLGGGLSPDHRARLAAENDWGVVHVEGTAVAVEQANITGTAGDDVLSGTAGADSIQGLGGNDQLYGGGGADTLDGGTGNDYFQETDEGDAIAGGDDNDRLDLYGKATGTTLAYKIGRAHV